MKTAFIFSLFIIACSVSLPPKPDCLPVDYEGSAEWMITPDKLILETVTGDFDGVIAVFANAETDNGLQMTGTTTGEFKAPIGDSSFTRIGSMTVAGMLTFVDGEYSIVLNVISGTEGFAGVTGYIESSWKRDDEWVYFGGTFCF